MIALSPKNYYCDAGEEEEKKKVSCKGMSKRHNKLSWPQFEEALEGKKDMAINRGFRMWDGQMVTHEQLKLGLSAYYDKCWVLDDGIHTEPIEFHI